MKYLITGVLIMLNTLHAQHRMQLRIGSRPSTETAAKTDDQGLPLGRGSIARTATHMILTSEDGGLRVEIPRGDLSTPEVAYSWERKGTEYVYTYVITNRADSKAPILTAALRTGPSFLDPRRLKPGESGTLVIKSPAPPVLQPMYVRSMSRSFREEMEAPAPNMALADQEFSSFVTRHMMQHNNTTIVYVMGPSLLPFDRAGETAASGHGVAGPEFAQRPID
jgi:hypothetical protein